MKTNGLDNTAYRIAKTWFIEEEKSKYFYLCEKAFKQTSLEAADNALVAMKNWSGIENLKNIKNETLIIWGNQDKAYNYNQVETLKEILEYWLQHYPVLEKAIKSNHAIQLKVWLNPY